MSSWLIVFCQNDFGAINPDSTLKGISKRLKALTYLYCPDDEEDIDSVLNRIRIVEDPQNPRTLHLYARKEPEKFIRITRKKISPNSESIQEQFEKLNQLPNQENLGLNQVYEYLKTATVEVEFQLLYSDLDTMAWPVAVATATWVAELGNGVIWHDEGQWMIPNNRDVTYIFDEKDFEK